MRLSLSHFVACGFHKLNLPPSSINMYRLLRDTVRSEMIVRVKDRMLVGGGLYVRAERVGGKRLRIVLWEVSE